MAKKQKKEWKPVVQERMARWKVVLLWGIGAFIPFFIFYLFPALVRNHILENSKLPEVVLDAVPEKITLLVDPEHAKPLPPTFVLNMKGVAIKIPHNMTPIEVDSEKVVFRASPRRNDKMLTIVRKQYIPAIDRGDSLFVKIFLPSDPLTFLDRSLHATWHPAYLTAKAHVLTSEGITRTILESEWDNKHRGYVFPLPGNRGYSGRIYGTEGRDYVEFTYLDDRQPLSKNEWIDLAREVRFDVPPASTNEQPLLSALNVEATDAIKSRQVVAKILNLFYATDNPRWMLPNAIVLGSRGFVHDLIDFHQTYAKTSEKDSDLAEQWNSILVKAMEEVLKIDLDMHVYKNLINMSCRNRTVIPLRNLELLITLSHPDKDQVFKQRFFSQGSLQATPSAEVLIDIIPPEGMSVRGATGISYKVLNVDITD